MICGEILSKCECSVLRQSYVTALGHSDSAVRPAVDALNYPTSLRFSQIQQAIHLVHNFKTPLHALCLHLTSETQPILKPKF